MTTQPGLRFLVASILLCAACGGDNDIFGTPAPDGADASVDGASEAATGGHGGTQPQGGSGGTAKGGSGGTSQGGSAGSPLGGSGGGSQGGSGGVGPCPGGCDDKVPCTIDSCVQNACAHAPGSCPAGQVCDLQAGCVSGPVCSTDGQCTAQWGSDACKANVHCDGATATCTYTLLDTDGDQHAPVVCGGDDCDDADAQRHPGLGETCDGKDNDCDGQNDNAAVCPGMQACQGGQCVCPAANQCGTACVDKSTDVNHCGACFAACPPLASCIAGHCTCPGSQTVCGAACVDTGTNNQHCGSCNHACTALQSCTGGACACMKTLCGGQCVDTQVDESHCGNCGVVCPVGATCTGGSCVCPANQPTTCSGACVDTTSNVNHCGSCGHACTSPATCVAGTCQSCLEGGLLILLDQSGSMTSALGTGTRFSVMLNAVTAFVQESDSAGVSVGVMYYPRLSTGTTPVCVTSGYATPTVEILPLPGNATAIVNSMTGKTATGSSVVSPVLEGAIGIVRAWENANPGHPGAVVMINDGGMGIGCSSDTQSWATSAASAGYSGTPSVATYIIGLGAPTSSELSTWAAIATAGGGTVQNTGTSGTQAVLDALHVIRSGYSCP